MSAALDIITLVLLLGMTFLGYKKGLAKSILQIAGGVLAIIIAFTFSAALGQFLSDSFIKPPIRKMVANEVAASTNVPVDGDVNKTIENIDMENALAHVPAPMQKLFDTFGTSADKVINKVGSDIDKTTTEYKNKVIDAIVTPVADGIARIIAFAVLFLLSSVAIFIISIPLGLVSKIPVIGSFNKAGGALLGAVQGIVLIFILATFITLISPVASGNKWVFKETTVEDTSVFEFFANINPIKF